MRPGWIRDAGVLLLPALLLLALHGPALDYDLVWTDEPELVQGTILRPPGTILRAFGEPLHRIEDPAAADLAQPYYRPLQVVTASWLAAEVGREPRVFRSVNLLLGALTAALFALLAGQLTASRPAALFAGLAFAAHPVGLEIYVWAGGLSAALMGTFAMASLGLGVAALRADTGRRAALLAALSLAGLALALLSKENAVVVPGLQLAIALGLLAQARASGADARPAPTVAAGLVAAQTALVAGYLFALRPAVLGTSVPGVKPIGGSLATQWLSSAASWPAQMGWLFLPLHSTTSDAVRVVTSAGDPLAWLGALLVLASAFAFFVLLARGRGVAAIGLAWLWIAFLPTSGVVPLLHARAERNLFLPAFGALLLVAGLAVGARSALRARTARIALGALAVLAVAGLAERTLARQPDWRSSLALFERDVAADPRHREGRMNLVLAYVKAGRMADAKRQVDALMRDRRPAGWTSYALDASLLEAACRVNRAVGRDVDTLRAVEELPPEQGVAAMPGFYDCYARSLERLGRCDEALPLYEALHRRTGSEAHARGAARCRSAAPDS